MSKVKPSQGVNSSISSEIRTKNNHETKKHENHKFGDGWKFVEGVGYVYEKNALVEMNKRGRPISEFDTGMIVGKHGEEEFYYDVKNDKTGQIETFHVSELMPYNSKHISKEIA